MQKFLTFTCTVFLITLSSFKPISGLDEVISSLRAGNASELSKYVDDNVEISLPDKTDSYSRAQALMVLQDFFTNNVVRNFEVKHKGDNGGNQYCIGTLLTKAGNYRTTIFMKLKGGKHLVKEIRFQSS